MKGLLNRPRPFFQEVTSPAQLPYFCKATSLR